MFRLTTGAADGHGSPERMWEVFGQEGSMATAATWVGAPRRDELGPAEMRKSSTSPPGAYHGQARRAQSVTAARLHSRLKSMSRTKGTVGLHRSDHVPEVGV